MNERRCTQLALWPLFETFHRVHIRHLATHTAQASHKIASRPCPHFAISSFISITSLTGLLLPLEHLTSSAGGHVCVGGLIVKANGTSH